MAATPQHTYQVLTKRPKRMRAIVTTLAQRHGVLPNVWLGTSIESRDYCWRAEHLRATPAAVRFISAEPLLGPLVGHAPRTRPDYFLDLGNIHWLIVGGESGPEYRPVDPRWVRDLRDYADTSDTAFFFKQWGGIRPKSGGRELDGRTYDAMPTVLV